MSMNESLNILSSEVPPASMICRRIFTLKRGFTGFILLFILFTIFVIYYNFLHDHLKDSSFLELHKCPACYGKDLCPLFFNGSIEFNGQSKYRLLADLNVKNVQTGMLNKSKKVVLKKLGHNWELLELDKKICKAVGKPGKCIVSEDIYRTSYATASEITADLFKGESDMVLCPSQRLVYYIIQNFKSKAQDNTLTIEERLYLTSALLINSEPILLQTFPQEQGWPFPKYYGACGRFIVEEHCGIMLSQFHFSPWEERIDLAYQMLLMADQLTNNEIGFSLYWTDVTYDNFAVNDKGRLFHIDLENIIVVDKAKIKREKRDGWDEPYYSTYNECEEYAGMCLNFNEDRLCSAYVSDINYYAVCRNILSSYANQRHYPGGLLHDLPSKEESILSPLLEECTIPSEIGGRMTVIPKLIETLRAIRRDVF